MDKGALYVGLYPALTTVGTDSYDSYQQLRHIATYHPGSVWEKPYMLKYKRLSTCISLIAIWF